MDTIACTLAPITLASFEKACLTLGLNPDEVRNSRRTETITVSDEQGRAFLEAVVDDPHPSTISADLARILLRDVIGEFFTACFAQIDQAERFALYYARRVGADRMPGGAFKGSSLARELSGFDPLDYDHVRNHMSLEDALFYLLIRGVHHFVKHIDDYLT